VCRKSSSFHCKFVQSACIHRLGGKPIHNADVDFKSGWDGYFVYLLAQPGLSARVTGFLNFQRPDRFLNSSVKRTA